MPPEIKQDVNHNLDENQLAAALGFATTLAQHVHKSQNSRQDPTAPQPQQTTEQAPTEPQPQEQKPQDHEAEQDQEIQSIRAELEQLLAEEQKPPDGTQTENTTATQ